MPNSLKAKIKKLRHDRKITDNECQYFIKKLDAHDRELVNKTIADYKDKIMRMLEFAELKMGCDTTEDDHDIMLDDNRIKFMLDGCDISFVAEAPKDITLEQLLKQCDRIIPLWCACGIRSHDPKEHPNKVEIIIDYDDVRKVDEDVNCRIVDKEVEEC